ncbi:uncharacterized protein LOC141899601 [Tubulanus polymorphus]|uniref:uncharacterized protein LOC141899601 n=1 Tax=Tubulanus polymorphus TaxID=672921 RepID=UPI003DA68607
MKGRIVIYSIVGCPHCIAAKNTLQQFILPYTDISLDIFPQCRQYVLERTGKKTVPQIFFNAKYIGGNDDLQKLVKEKKAFDKLVEDVKNNTVPPDAPQIPDPSTAVSSHDPSDFICEPDEYARLVTELKQSGLIQDNRSGILTVHKNSFSGKKFVDWVVNTKNVERVTAIEMGQQLIDRHFGHNVHKEEIFQDSDVYYRLMEDDDSLALNSGSVSECKVSSAGELSENLRKLILLIYSKHLSKDGKTVDYKGIGKSPEFQKYVRLTQELQRLNMNSLSREETLAFFINVYNALVIHATVVKGPPVNLWQRWKFFNTVKYMIGGSEYSLQAIENGVLRGNRKGMGMISKPFGQNDPRLNIALDKADPKIHFALVCGAKSCPPIKTYSTQDVDNELQLATEAFLEGDEGVSIDISKSKVNLSKIFNWYKIDFGQNDEEMLEWICFHMSTGDKKLQLQELINKKNYKISYLHYDWSLNSK